MQNEVFSKGLIYLIDRFVAEDGPGIRTTIFFKKCPLRCIWCHSPQCQLSEKQLAFYPNRCIGCGTCVKICAQYAQIASPIERNIRWENCNNCGMCAEICPSKALEMLGKWLTVDQLTDLIIRDLIYYRNSGGGVTFSGGEPLAQPDFLTLCLKKCKDMDIHTALDTCGFSKWSVFEAILPYVDLFLYDIKQMDSKRHKQFTGVSNKGILENLKKISQRGKSIWLRIPLIPEHTDSKENLLSISKFIKELGRVEKVCLLPYNIASGAKYLSIGKKYELDHIGLYPKEKIQDFVEIFANQGIKAEAGQ